MTNKIDKLVEQIEGALQHEFNNPKVKKVLKLCKDQLLKDKEDKKALGDLFDLAKKRGLFYSPISPYEASVRSQAKKALGIEG